MRMALLIVDMQIDFLKEEHLRERAMKAAEHINYVSDLLRKNGHTVIHIQDIEVEGGESSDGFELVPYIQVEDSDLMVRKEWSNAFWKTDLEERLLDRGVSFVMVAGFAAEHCVIFTLNGAIERGFKAALLHGGVVSRHEDVMDMTYRERFVISYPAIEFMVQHGN